MIYSSYSARLTADDAAPHFTYEDYCESADMLASRSHNLQPEALLILGSGLGFLGDTVEDPIFVDYDGIPHFRPSTAPGHKGRFVFGTLRGRRVAVMQGRIHCYEGYSMEQAAYAVRVARLLGAKTLFVTNAAGCVNTDWGVGELMLLTDHIKLFDFGPLWGPNLEEFGTRFPDMTTVYTPRLQTLARETAKAHGIPLREGVYMYFPGPQFETPAEVRAARVLGADAVGMSTVPEAIAAAGAIAGVTIGTVLSLLYMAVNYLRHRPALRRGEPCAPGGAILRRLLALAVPITLASSMVSIITLIDTKLVQGQLQSALGYTLDETRALYGNYAACMNLYNLPSSLMVALTASVIPAVSAAIAQRNGRQTARIVRSSFRVTALLAFPMGLGLWSLSDPIFRLFYRRYNAELGGRLLAVLGIASIFVCLMLITNSILQAYGRVNLPILTMLLGGVVKIVLNYNLVAIPSVNIHGAPIGTLVCFALTALLNLIAVSRITHFRLNYPGYFLRPLLASLAMAFAARGTYALASRFLVLSSERLTLFVCVFLSIGVAVAVYGALVLALHCIRRSDLELLPKGGRIADLLHIS